MTLLKKIVVLGALHTFGFGMLAACTSGDTGATPVAGADASGTDAFMSSQDAPATDTSMSATDSAPEGATDASKCVAVLDGGAQCNTVANVGTAVSLVVTGMPMPVGTGGPVADGHYVLTDFKAYNGSLLTVSTLKQTLEICSNVAQLVGDDDAAPEYRKTFTIAPSGIAPNPAPVCTTQVPNVDIPYSSYTATSKVLTLFSTTYLFTVTYTQP